MFQISFPPVTTFDWVLALLIGITSASALVFLLLDSDAQTKLSDAIPRPRWLWLLLSAMIAALFIPALAAAITLLTQIAFGDPAEVQQTSLGTGALIAAILGAPFIIWRTLVAQRQANTQEESLFNEKINAAATDLAARRQVNRGVNEGTPDETILSEWQDDLVTRATAIDRLEGLANHYPESTQRIARQLAIYIRELSREYRLNQVRNQIAKNGSNAVINSLAYERPDMEKAAQTLGRLQGITDNRLVSSDIDLRDAELNSFSLSGLTLESAILQRANLNGTNLSSANLRRINLSYSNLTGAVLFGATFNKANLFRAILSASNLSGADLSEANLSETNLNSANLFGADLRRANLSRAGLVGANLVRTNFKNADLSEANLQSANLSGADLSGTRLFGTLLAEDTKLQGTSFHSAAVMSLNDASIEKLRPFWKDIFSDGSIPVSLDDVDRPKHWPTRGLSYGEFDRQWRTWQATLAAQEPDT
nr:pentapeptide repeat-containing protein [Octadecabacter dasysiphoniae]